MRKTLKLVLAAALGTVVVPTLAYLAFPSDEDPMGETLSELGFVRVPLPSNLMNVGSLYYVDAGLKDQLAAHLQPIVARAGTELVQAINDHVGQLVRTYVAEAIEREIAQWRKQNT